MLNKIFFSKQSAGMLIFILVFALTGSLSAAGEGLSADSDYIDLFELAFTNRSALIRGETDYDFTINALEDLIYQFDREELEALAGSAYLKKLASDDGDVITAEALSLEQALKDVDFLFKTLKLGYAGYQIYGGDERFSQARREITAELESWTAAGEEIPLAKFEDILFSGINFIEDTHFSLAGRQMGVEYTLYVSNQYAFNKVKENGMSYHEQSGENDKFVSLGDKGPDETMWPVLDQNGQLVYLPGVFRPYDPASDEGLKEKMLLTTDEDGTAKEIDLLLYPLSSSGQAQNLRIYRRSEIEGIPLIEVGSFAARDRFSSRYLENFVADAADLKDTSSLIIDIRGNTGGSDQYPYSWMQKFTGQQNISRNSLSVNVRTEVSKKLMENSLRLFPEAQQDQLRQQLTEHFDPLEEGWGEIHTAVPQFISGETKIVVLLDSRVMSAGESFVRYLQQLENVIFIGSNTRGMGIVGNVGRFNLPNSGIEVSAGTTIFLDTDLVNREGKGYLPDFWVEPSQAKDIAVKILSDGN